MEDKDIEDILDIFWKKRHREKNCKIQSGLWRIVIVRG